MKFESEVMFLKTNSPYTQGEKTYYSGSVLAEGTVYRVSMSAELYSDLQNIVESKGKATFNVEAYQSTPRLVLTSFK